MKTAATSGAVLSALIVDDEPIARRVLREELAEFPSVAIAGEAETGEDALTQLASLAPDLVFLDLEMPAMDGLEFLSRVPKTSSPAVVVVTAYDQYAIRALEAGAVDYLLKPVSQARLAQSIARVERLVHSSRPEEIPPRQQPPAASLPAGEFSRKIVGKQGDEFFLLDLREILAFQADGDLVWIVTARQRLIATQNMKAIEERLRHSSFRRVHRNAIVNVNHIRKMSALSSQRWLLTLNNAQEFTVSKRQARNIRDVLKW